MTKYTNNDYLAAAFAQNNWANEFWQDTGPVTCDDACREYWALREVFDSLWQAAAQITDGKIQEEKENIAYLAAQLGCEKAGL